LRIADFFTLILLGALWGGAFPLLRVASPEFGPVSLVTVRLAVAALVLVPYARDLAQMFTHWRKLLVMGLLNSAIPFALFSFATLSITGGLASLLNATTPMFGALVAYLWLRERLDLVRVLGICIGFGGVALIVWGEVGGHAANALPGVFAGLAGAALYGIAASFGKRNITTISAPVMAAGSVLGSLVAILPFGIWAWPERAPSGTAWVAVVALGLLSTAVAYIVYFRLLVRIKASQAVTVTFLIPVFGILWGALFLGEPVTPSLLKSAVIVLIGTALATGLLRFSKRGATP
jgi:drug/metabolite transporter (DMT)-like permease